MEVADPDEPDEPEDLREERTICGMRLEKTGRGCYLAYSQSRPETAYAVDINAYNGLGSCECDDFRFRRYPRWKTVRQPFDVLRCRHLRRVRTHVLDQIIKFYAKAEQQQ
jgi:hypothetical protein